MKILQEQYVFRLIIFLNKLHQLKAGKQTHFHIITRGYLYNYNKKGAANQRTILYSEWVKLLNKTNLQEYWTNSHVVFAKMLQTVLKRIILYLCKLMEFLQLFLAFKSRDSLSATTYLIMLAKILG